MCRDGLIDWITCAEYMIVFIVHSNVWEGTPCIKNGPEVLLGLYISCIDVFIFLSDVMKNTALNTENVHLDIDKWGAAVTLWPYWPWWLTSGPYGLPCVTWGVARVRLRVCAGGEYEPGILVKAHRLPLAETGPGTSCVISILCRAKCDKTRDNSRLRRSRSHVPE